MSKSGTTYFQTKAEALKDNKWLLIDAAGVPLGRLASEVATLLKGKHKRTFTPHLACGDFVVVLNASKVALSGDKREAAIRRHHTGYMGGLKEIKVSAILERAPEKLVRMAVRGMFHKSALTHQIMQKLKVYAGENHPHGAQKPAKYSLRCVRNAAKS